MFEVKRALGWTLRKVAGCIVSHEHQDHAKYIKSFLKCGIKVLALPCVFDSQEISNRAFCRPVKPMQGYKVGAFKVFTLPVAHDAPCLGFIIEHPEMGKTLFVTDTMMLEYKVAGLNHIMIEANYADDILQENIDNGTLPHTLRDRLLQSHMELQTTADVIRNCDLSNVNDIVLLHLSGNNANPARFRDEIIKVSGKPVFVAKNGLKIAFSKQYF